jgi:hypothetical protein
MTALRVHTTYCGTRKKRYHGSVFYWSVCLNVECRCLNAAVLIPITISVLILFRNLQTFLYSVIFSALEK